MMVMHLSISTTLIKNSHNIIYIQNQKNISKLCVLYVQYDSHTFAYDMYIFRISCLTIHKNKMLRGRNGSRF